MTQIKKAGALIIKNNRLMIVKPHKRPFFINPGGQYEHKETAKDCLARELKEELGINLISYSYYKSYNIIKAAHNKYPILLELYFVDYEGEPKPLSEIKEIEWLSVDDFTSNKFNLAPSFYDYVPDLIRDSYL